MAEVGRDVLAGTKHVVRQALHGWSEHRSPQSAAALAYYIVFSVAPLLVLATALVGLVYGGRGASAVIDLVSKSTGPTVSAALRDVLVAASRPRTGVSASVLGLIALLAGAAGAFTSVQAALDQIWGVRPKPHRGVRGFVRDRLPAFLLLLIVGAILVASLGASTILGRLAASLPRPGLLPGGVLTGALDLVLFVAVMTVLFALVFRVLPDARLRWRDVWSGGLVTAVLFTLGQALVAAYLSLVHVGSAFGAAGTLVAVLVWLYYSGLVFLFGAELTRVMVLRRGSPIEPSSNAERIEPCPPNAEADEPTGQKQNAEP